MGIICIKHMYVNVLLGGIDYRSVKFINIGGKIEDETKRNFTQLCAVMKIGVSIITVKNCP